MFNFLVSVVSIVMVSEPPEKLPCVNEPLPAAVTLGMLVALAFLIGTVVELSAFIGTVVALSATIGTVTLETPVTFGTEIAVPSVTLDAVVVLPVPDCTP